MFVLIICICIAISVGDTSIGSANVAKGETEIVEKTGFYTFKYPCNSGTSCTFYTIVLPEGRYLLEVWGAQGGNTDSGGIGGKGGFSRGILSLLKETKLFIHIGGQPANSSGYPNYVSIFGGYNGGGGSVSTSNCNGGGGGTDIRINENTLYHRVIVAGGGGGGEGKQYNYPAGAGGGIEGNASTYGPPTNGGKQDQGGTGGYVSSNGGSQGSFGIGGVHGRSSAGGGGGWYGGSGSNNNYDSTGGAGGSGYVFNQTSFKPTDFKLTSEYFLSDCYTIQGTQKFLSPDGKYEIGHSGHGAAKISIINSTKHTVCRCTNNCYKCRRNPVFLWT